MKQRTAYARPYYTATRETAHALDVEPSRMWKSKVLFTLRVKPPHAEREEYSYASTTLSSR